MRVWDRSTVNRAVRPSVRKHSPGFIAQALYNVFYVLLQANPWQTGVQRQYKGARGKTYFSRHFSPQYATVWHPVQTRIR